MGKVVHLPSDLHGQLKVHCKRNRLSMREVVADLIVRYLNGGMKEAAQPHEPPAPRVDPVPVEKKKLPQPMPEDEGGSPYQQPPFWKDRSKKDVPDGTDDRHDSDS